MYSPIFAVLAWISVPVGFVWPWAWVTAGIMGLANLAGYYFGNREGLTPKEAEVWGIVIAVVLAVYFLIGYLK